MWFRVRSVVASLQGRRSELGRVGAARKERIEIQGDVLSHNTELGDVLLVGSGPWETVEDAFRGFSRRVGDRVTALPDGEVGPRSGWIIALPHMTYEKNPDLEPIRVVPPEAAGMSPAGHGKEEMTATFGTFRFKPGVTETRFDLHFGHEAVKSYEVFQRLRAEGVIREDVRFQVGIPFTSDGVDLFFPEPADVPIAYRSYVLSAQDTIKLLLDHIPADDLAIQWDYCTEVLHCIGALDSYADEQNLPSLEERFQMFTSPEYVAPMSETIPEDVVVGYHLCFGTWGGWPIGRVLDMELIVRLANALVAHTPRRVDYLHLPGMPDAPEGFWSALGDLDIGNTKVYLGVELADGFENLLERAAQARKYLSNFGIAHYCGYGRDVAPQVGDLLDQLRTGAERLSAQ